MREGHNVLGGDGVEDGFENSFELGKGITAKAVPAKLFSIRKSGVYIRDRGSTRRPSWMRGSLLSVRW